MHTFARRLIHTVAAITLMVGTASCKSPCDELAARLCVQADNDSELCARWQDRAKRVPTETCEAGLRTLDRDRVR
jgi:hypothetical protein